MTRHELGLADYGVDHFIEQGFVCVRGAFPRKVFEAGRGGRWACQAENGRPNTFGGTLEALSAAYEEAHSERVHSGDARDSACDYSEEFLTTSSDHYAEPLSIRRRG